MFARYKVFGLNHKIYAENDSPVGAYCAAVDSGQSFDSLEIYDTQFEEGFNPTIFAEKFLQMV